jgi:Zn-dependent peptidase ImmA (M78 family)
MELIEGHGEEQFCDAFAAEVLVPRGDLSSEIKVYKGITNRNISTLASAYGVSRQVAGLRLFYLRYIDRSDYLKFTSGSRKKPKGKVSGRKDWDTVFSNRVGKLVISEVKQSYSKNAISLMDAIEILDVKTKYADEMLQGS